MIKIKEYEVKNSIEELTIEQFEEVSRITNDLGLDYVEKQLKLFSFLGVPEEVLDALTIPELKEAVKEFNDVPNKKYPFVQELEIDGYIYKAYEGEDFIINAKDFSLIEKKIKKQESYISYLMAVIFKRTDLTKTEHYESAHLKLKEKLFRKLPAATSVAYLTAISKEVVNVSNAKVEK